MITGTARRRRAPFRLAGAPSRLARAPLAAPLPAAVGALAPLGGRLVPLATALALLAAFAAHAHAGRVIELFTSHGCSSCPRADRLLGELIEADPELVALEFHVDYWNSLVHGGDGNFVDPFSSTAWSLRQRAYDGVALGGRRGVYTPQAIVDGAVAAVGSDRASIARARGEGTSAVTAPVGGPADGPVLRIVRDGDELLIDIDGVSAGERSTRTAGHLPLPAPDTGEVALVRFLRRTVTPITGGENRGRELVNHRVVTAVETLGRVAADGTLAARVSAPTDPAEGCAVLVRHDAAKRLAAEPASSPSAEVPRTHLAGMLCPDPA